MGEKEATAATEAGRMKAGLDTAGGALATGAARQTPKRDFGDRVGGGEPGGQDEKHVYQQNQTDMDFVR